MYTSPPISTTSKAALRVPVQRSAGDLQKHPQTQVPVQKNAGDLQKRPQMQVPVQKNAGDPQKQPKMQVPVQKSAGDPRPEFPVKNTGYQGNDLYRETAVEAGFSVQAVRRNTRMRLFRNGLYRKTASQPHFVVQIVKRSSWIKQCGGMEILPFDEGKQQSYWYWYLSS